MRGPIDEVKSRAYSPVATPEAVGAGLIAILERQQAGANSQILTDARDGRFAAKAVVLAGLHTLIRIAHHHHPLTEHLHTPH